MPPLLMNGPYPDFDQLELDSAYFRQQTHKPYVMQEEVQALQQQITLLLDMALHPAEEEFLRDIQKFLESEQTMLAQEMYGSLTQTLNDIRENVDFGVILGVDIFFDTVM